MVEFEAAVVEFPIDVLPAIGVGVTIAVSFSAPAVIDALRKPGKVLSSKVVVIAVAIELMVTPTPQTPFVCPVKVQLALNPKMSPV